MSIKSWLLSICLPLSLCYLQHLSVELFFYLEGSKKNLTALRKLILLLSLPFRVIKFLADLIRGCLGLPVSSKGRDFFNFEPLEDDFHCLAITSTGTRCGSTIRHKDRQLASNLRNSFSTFNPYDQKLASQLTGYANHCHCHLHRSVKSSHNIIKAWGSELKSLWMNDSRRCTSVSDLFDPEIQDNTTSIKPCSPGRNSMPRSDESRRRTNLVPLRYHARFLLSEEEEEEEEQLASTDDQSIGFSKFERAKASVSLRDAVVSNLSVLDSQHGIVYIYRRKISAATAIEDAKYMKIGFTKQTPGKSHDDCLSSRYGAIEESCGYKPILIKSFVVDNAKRVETLVHLDLELNNSSRRTLKCGPPNGCKTLHREWFEISEEEAISTVYYWNEWMKNYEPYDDFGKLKPKYLWAFFAKDRDQQQSTIGFYHNYKGNIWHQNGFPLKNKKALKQQSKQATILLRELRTFLLGIAKELTSSLRSSLVESLQTDQSISDIDSKDNNARQTDVETPTRSSTQRLPGAFREDTPSEDPQSTRNYNKKVTYKPLPKACKTAYEDSDESSQSANNDSSTEETITQKPRPDQRCASSQETKRHTSRRNISDQGPRSDPSTPTTKPKSSKTKGRAKSLPMPPSPGTEDSDCIETPSPCHRRGSCSPSIRDDSDDDDETENSDHDWSPPPSRRSVKKPTKEPTIEKRKSGRSRKSM